MSAINWTILIVLYFSWNLPCYSTNCNDEDHHQLRETLLSLTHHGHYGYDSGLQRIIQEIDALAKLQKVIFVVIYGLPNSGKTHVIKQLKRIYEKRKFIVMGTFEGPPNEQIIKRLKRYEEEELKDHRILCLFHCAWTSNVAIFNPEHDPTSLIPSIIGRDVDLKIGMVNFSLYKAISGKYDIVIRNEQAKIKGQLIEDEK